MTITASETIRPFDAVMLDVGDGHWIYIEQVGTKGGVPALFLHGGPGSGAQHSHRNVFDPKRFHTFLFDQRGAGRSHPYLSTDNNTTAHLIRDIEVIRTFYGIDRWLIVGGSWGSTLALAYAQAHPDRVTGLVLRAVFLGSEEEVQWAFKDGPRRFRPELYSAFVAQLPKDNQHDPVTAYIARLRDPDPARHKPAAEVWHAYERGLSELQPAPLKLPHQNASSGTQLKPTPIMEAHYIHNRFFLEPGQLLSGMDKIKDTPGVIVQGRYDLLCPPKSAHAIAARWPACSLSIIDNAGHAMTEPGIAAAMRTAISELAEKM